MPIRVFLSYARDDDPNDYDDPTKSFMRRLRNSLVDAKFEVWWDKVSMPSRALSFSQEISDALDRMDKVILVVGAASGKSEYVKAEWQYALNICLPVIPVLLNVGFDKIPKKLKNQHTVDFQDLTKFDERVHDLTRLLEDSTLPLGRLHNLDRLPAHYIVRQKEMKKVKGYLLAEATKPTVITSSKQALSVYGMGGIGKSTLSNALCRDCSIRFTFANGIVWLNVGKKPEIQRLQAQLGEFLGDNPAEYTDVEKGKIRLSAQTYGKKLLVILDDVWEEAVVNAFGTLAEGCRLLVTTRDQLLAKLTGGNNYDLGKLDEAEALALFKKYLGASVKGIEDSLKAIIALVDGHTLALDLAGAQLLDRPDYAPRLLTRMQHQFRQEQGNKGVFSDLQLAEEDKNRNLETSLGISYVDLDSVLQGRFRALGILAPNATFPQDLAMAVWATPLNETEDTLVLLCRNSLLTREKDGRYRQQGLLNAYARALATRAGELTEVETRYFEWVITFAEQFITLPPEEWRDQLDPDVPHVLYVGDTLYAHYIATPTDETLQESAGWFIFRARRYLSKRREVRRIEWLEMGLAIGDQLENDYLKAMYLGELGIVWNDLGEKPKALDYFQQALSLHRAIGDQDGEATNLSNIGGVWDSLGEKHKALDYFQQALPLSVTVGNQEREATTLNNMGGVWDSLGEFDKALDYFQQAYQILHKIGNKTHEATTLNNIGGVWADLGDKHKALDYFQQALPLRRAVGDQAGEATTLNNIGGLRAILGENDKALDYFQQALIIFQTIGNRAGEATTLNNIGRIWANLGEKDKVLDYYQQSYQIFHEIGDKLHEARGLNNIGGAWDDLGEKDKALDYYQQALPTLTAVGDRTGETVTCYNIGMIYAEQGNLDQAIEYIERCVLLKEQLQYPDLTSDRATLERLKKVRSGGGQMPSKHIMPTQQIDVIVFNTVAVKTEMPKKLAEWRQAMQEFQEEMQQQGGDYTIDVGFAQALLAILDNQPVTIPADNPYYPHVKRIRQAIRDYRNRM